MAGIRSFTDYVRNTFDNQFWAIADEYLRENINPLDMKLFKVHKAGEPEITDLQAEHVWVKDLLEMKIQFDVATSVTFEIPEADYHYDGSQEKKIY